MGYDDRNKRVHDLLYGLMLLLLAIWVMLLVGRDSVQVREAVVPRDHMMEVYTPMPALEPALGGEGGTGASPGS